LKVKLWGGIALMCAAAPAFAGPFLLATTNDTLWKVDDTGVASAFATGFTSARGVTVGPDGNYYVADLAGSIVKVDSGTGNTSAFATLGKAYGVAWQGDTLYATAFDSTNTISKFDTTGAAAGSISTGQTGSNLTDLLFGNNGDLYVSSQGAKGVLHIDSENNVTLFADTSGQAAFDINGNNVSTPRGIALVGDSLYVSDSASCSCSAGGNNITIFDATTGLFTGTLVAPAGNPQGLAFDTTTNDFYFASNTGGGILISDLAGTTTSYASIAGTHDLVILSGAPEPGTALLMFGALSAAVLKFRRRQA
jgi:DNA-binding beta-propeller fold protein YncE